MAQTSLVRTPNKEFRTLMPTSGLSEKNRISSVKAIQSPSSSSSSVSVNSNNLNKALVSDTKAFLLTADKKIQDSASVIKQVAKDHFQAILNAPKAKNDALGSMSRANLNAMKDLEAQIKQQAFNTKQRDQAIELFFRTVFDLTSSMDQSKQLKYFFDSQRASATAKPDHSMNAKTAAVVSKLTAIVDKEANTLTKSFKGEMKSVLESASLSLNQNQANSLVKLMVRSYNAAAKELKGLKGKDLEQAYRAYFHRSQQVVFDSMLKALKGSGAIKTLMKVLMSSSGDPSNLLTKINSQLSSFLPTNK